MDTLPVTLIVKAPNQQIEDQTIKCELSWTINKLKQHLSEVYPSKPPKHEQKLIYSGQLLSDSVILKDVLRQFDGQDTHTVHLVCAPKNGQPRRQQQNNQQQQQPSAPQTPNMTQNPPTSSQTNSSSATTADQRVPNLYPNNVQWLRPENAEQLALQMQMMQQAYIQYLTQYMNLNNPNLPIYQNIQQPGLNIPQQNVPRVQPQAPEPQIPPQPVPAQQQPRDPDHPNRDWLDVFYMLSRVMVFVSIVYFYSSPIRFVFVLLFGLGLYLYQIGFFRNVNINNNNIVQGENGAEDQAPSRLMVVWTFFTSFFTSLIPEIPNVV